MFTRFIHIVARISASLFSLLSNIPACGWAFGLSYLCAAVNFAVLDVQVQVFMWTLFSVVLNTPGSGGTSLFEEL